MKGVSLIAFAIVAGLAIFLIAGVGAASKISQLFSSISAPIWWLILLFVFVIIFKKGGKK